jgi:hypothetical protein
MSCCSAILRNSWIKNERQVRYLTKTGVAPSGKGFPAAKQCRRSSSSPAVSTLWSIAG